jgi:hypothetical protein
MNFMRLAAPLALAFGLSAPAFAGTTIYECKVATGTENGWISSPVIIAHVDGSDEATAVDPVIQGEFGKPVTAKLKAENDAKITFGWVVKSQSTSGQNVSMSYRAIILKGSNTFVLSATPLGYANTFRGDGKCKVSRKG